MYIISKIISDMSLSGRKQLFKGDNSVILAEPFPPGCIYIYCYGSLLKRRLLSFYVPVLCVAAHIYQFIKRSVLQSFGRNKSMKISATSLNLRLNQQNNPLSTFQIMLTSLFRNKFHSIPAHFD